MSEDPGWSLSGGGRGKGTPPTMLASPRIIYLSLVIGVLLFTLVVTFLVATGSPPDDPPIQFAIPVIVIGVVLLGVRPWVAPSLDTTDAKSLAESYQGRMIVRMALGEAPVLFAIVVFFLTYTWWMLAVVIVLGVVGMLPPAPTRAAIEEEQQNLITQGSSLSLMDALARPAPKR